MKSLKERDRQREWQRERQKDNDNLLDFYFVLWIKYISLRTMVSISEGRSKHVAHGYKQTIIC